MALILGGKITDGFILTADKVEIPFRKKIQWTNAKFVTGNNSYFYLVCDNEGSRLRLCCLPFPLKVCADFRLYIYEANILGPRWMKMGSGEGSTMRNFIVCTVHLIYLGD